MPILSLMLKEHRFANTFFDAKESIQRLLFLPLLSLMPKKVTKDKTAKRFWTALAGPEGVKP